MASAVDVYSDELLLCVAESDLIAYPDLEELLKARLAAGNRDVKCHKICRTLVPGDPFGRAQHRPCEVPVGAIYLVARESKAQSGYSSEVGENEMIKLGREFEDRCTDEYLD